MSDRLGMDAPGRKRWAWHGSTRWLWKPQSVSAAIRYVVDEQDDYPMAVLEALDPLAKTAPFGRYARISLADLVN